MNNASRGEEAIRRGSWVKLICGASNQDLSSITDLCAVYAVAGVHCIDVSADQAVVVAARKGLDWAELNHKVRPWLMISVSDGEDIHFRKAWFDNAACPKDCSKPCEKICPVHAINQIHGINPSLCYGCGRCLPTCPYGLINEKSHRLELDALAALIRELQPDAIEIHTAPGRLKAFEKTITQIMKSKVPLMRIAVSCGLEGHGINAEELAEELWKRHACLRTHDQRPIWQLDGRPMSGDMNPSTAKVAIALWEKIHHLAPPGPLQLAGGTNASSIGLAPLAIGLSGIAFGGSARSLLQPWLDEAQAREIPLWEWTDGWETALTQAKLLVRPWLTRNTKQKKLHLH